MVKVHQTTKEVFDRQGKLMKMLVRLEEKITQSSSSSATMAIQQITKEEDLEKIEEELVGEKYKDSLVSNYNDITILSSVNSKCTILEN